MRKSTNSSFGSLYAPSIYDPVELLGVSSLTLPNLFGFWLIDQSAWSFLRHLATRRSSGQTAQVEQVALGGAHPWIASPKPSIDIVAYNGVGGLSAYAVYRDNYKDKRRR